MSRPGVGAGIASSSRPFAQSRGPRRCSATSTGRSRRSWRTRRTRAVPAATRRVLGELARRYGARGVRDRSPRDRGPADGRDRGARPTPATTASSCCHRRCRGCRAGSGRGRRARAARGSSCSISMPRTSSGRGCASRTRARSRRFTGAGPSTRSSREQAARADRRAGPSRAGLVPDWGRKVLELRAVADVDKGTAVRAAAGRGLGRARPVRRRRPDRSRRVRGAARDGGRGAAARRRLRRASPRDEAPPELAERADVVVDGPGGFLEVLARLLGGGGRAD